MENTRLSSFLGWFSIGLGAAEIVAPRLLCRPLGAGCRTTLVRSFGAREIASGIGILTSPGPKAPWLWSRVGGDATDLVALSKTIRPSRRRAAVIATIGGIAAITVLDVIAAIRMSGRETQTIASPATAS